MAKTSNETYDYICFSDLAYELDYSDRQEIEKKIKQRLKYYNLGEYKQERIDYIRKLKNDLYQEISLKSRSKYYKKSASNFTGLNDFDIDKMKYDFLENYNKIDSSDIHRILHFAVYLYHIR